MPDFPVITLKDLYKRYPMGDTAVEALRHISLDIRRGEFVAVMGASGSGKSTLMNIIGCLDQATSGTYLFDGVDIRDFDRNRLALFRSRKIGFVFQSFNLLSRTTALENVELPLLYNPEIPPALAQRKALSSLDIIGLKDRALHFSTQLSGGQQQRVAIARAIVNEPLLLLADEPTGNLDTRTSVEIMAIFQRLNREGMTVVLVTHELDIAEYSGRNITFRDGRVLSDVRVAHPRDAEAVLASLPALETV
jgi:putative ABC transport system ATP-binding protein